MTTVVSRTWPSVSLAIDGSCSSWSGAAKLWAARSPTEADETAGSAQRCAWIGLAPGARGQGLGRRLLQTLELEAMRLGIVVIKFGGADRGGRGLLRPHGLHRARVNGVQGTAFVESLWRGAPSEVQNLLSARPASPRGLSGPLWHRLRLREAFQRRRPGSRVEGWIAGARGWSARRCRGCRCAAVFA